MRSPSRLSGAILLAALPLVFGEASEVSRTPPPLYAEQLAAQLTPLEDVLPGRTAFPENKAGGIHLLRERISYRDATGMDFRVLHLVKHVSEQSGVEAAGSDTFTFDRAREEIFLIDAATILADGRRQSVDGKGAFIQTPQREADQSLYTSEAELQLVFPNVAPGTSTEAIVLIREFQPVMPGEFALVTTYGAGWPVFRHRTVLDFPADDLAGLHTFTNGAGVPQPQSESYTAGRERRTWQRDKLPHVAWEERGPSWEFRGPTLWLTTLESWDEVAAWYHRLLAGRDELGAELAAEVDRWTDGLADQRAIIDRLTEIVANDVRYVGLEFGIAGYQPHACREVWENRYGDCKDKANLLRAMLAHKGITAHLVLLQTTGMGRIEKASPSWRHFDHAILAVEQAAGEWLFCDPTIKFLPAGTLGLSDLGRDVLIIRGERAEWAVTPDTLDSAIRISAELALAGDGGLSGWFTFGTTGADAAYYAKYFAGLDRDGRRRSLQGYAERFFSGAEVVDVEFTPPTGSVRQAAVRAFMVRAPRTAGEQTLAFPYPASWLPGVTTAGDRRFPYEASRREEAVDVVITLPENWRARSLPAAFSAPSNVAEFNAAWTVAEGKLTARLAWHPRRAVLAPTEYGAFQRSIRALTSWLEQPAVLAPVEGAAAVASADGSGEPTLHNFPILPTGEGQLRLVEEKYPGDKSDVLRQAALQRVLQWFPSDLETVFEARTKLALLDWEHDRTTDTEFADQLAALLARYGAQTSASNRSWGTYLEAKARWLGSKDPTAIARLQALADDTSLSEFRRGWSAEAAGRYLSDIDPVAALDFLQRHDDYDSEARDAIVRLIARIHARRNDAAGLRTWISGITREHPGAADALLATAIGALTDAKTGFPAASQAKVLAAFTATITSADAFPRSWPRLGDLRDAVSRDEARIRFTTTVISWVQKHPPSWWTRGRISSLPDIDAVVKQIEEHNDRSEGRRVVDHLLQLLRYHEPDFDMMAKYTRWSLWWLRRSKDDQDLLDVISRATLELPAAASTNVAGCWLLRGLHLADRGDAAAARQVFQRVFDAPTAADHQRVEAGGELGLLEARAWNIDAALAAFHRIVPMQLSHKWAADYLYVAMLLHLERGEFDAALQLLEEIRRQPQDHRDKGDFGLQFTHLLRAAGQPEALKRFWARRAAWRPQWHALLATRSIAPGAPGKPAFERDVKELADKLKQALKDKDAAAYLRAMDTHAQLAQWVPMFITDFNNAAINAAGFSKELQEQLFAIGLAMTTDLEPVDPQFDANGRYWEVALLHDLHRKPEACAKARAALAVLDLDHVAAQRILRTWVLAARGTAGEDEVVARLAAELVSERTFHDRLRTVRILSDSYHARGDKDAQRALLTRETMRSDFDGAAEDGKVLTTRLAQLRETGAEATALTAAVTNWMEQQDLSWFPHVAPTALDDTRFAGLKPPQMETPAGFARAEVIKFNLLAAQDERLPAATRTSAWYSAAFDLALQSEYSPGLIAVLGGLAEHEAATNAWRATALVNVLQVLANRGDHVRLATLSQHPAYTIIRPEIRDDCERARRALARLARGGDDAAVEAWATLTQKPLERFSVAAAEHIIQRLAWQGAETRAEEFIASARDLTLDPGLTVSVPALRLGWTRLVRTAREQRPLVEALNAILRQLPAGGKEVAARMRERLSVQDAANLDDAERIALALDRLETGEDLPDDLGPLLLTLLLARKTAAERPMLFPDLLTASLHAPGSDEAKASCVMATAFGCDIDLPDVRARLAALYDTFLASSEANRLPRTRQSVLFANAYLALRTSRDSRPRRIFDTLDLGTLPAPTRLGLQLRFHQTRGNQDECLHLIETLDPSALTEVSLYAHVRAALIAAGREDEVTLYDEVVRDQLRRAMPALWMRPLQDNFRPMMALALTIGARDIFTKAWFERATAMATQHADLAMLHIYRAWLNEDWNELRNATDELAREKPDYYDNYFSRAIARHQLGDNAGTAADLRLFLTYCRNSEHYPAALALWASVAPDEAFEVPE